MKNMLLELLSPNQAFTAHEQHLKYKFIFLNRLFLIFGLMAIGISVYRWNAFTWANTINFGVAAGSFVLCYYLRQNKEKVELIGTIAIVSAFIACYAIYLLALDNRLRVVLFFPLVAGIFYLKGVRTGLAWLFFIIFSILAGRTLTGVETGYASNEIVVACLYLFVLFFILWNYEMVREQQQKREQEYELQKMIDGRWRLALEGVGDAIWDWNIQANQFTFSKSYADMLGYIEEEIGHTPAHLEQLLHPEDKNRVTSHLTSYLAGEIGGQYVSEQRLRCKDDGYKWILSRGRVTQRDDSGRPQRMVGTHVDITERKRIDMWLKESETRLHLALESAHMGVWDFNFGTNELYWSPEIFRLFGLPNYKVTLENFFEQVHPDDAAPVQAALEKAVADHTPFFAEFRFGEPGNLHWAEDRGEVQYDENGRPLRVVGTVQDITERKRIEASLKESEMRLHLALDSARMGVWDFDVKTRKLYWSPEIYRHFDVGNIEPSEDALMKLVHPEDATRIKAAMDRSIAECTPYLVEYRIGEPGRQRWVEDRGEVQCDEHGHPLRVIGTAQDITERKEHEKQLQHIAHYDALTGVPNRVLLADRLSQALARTKRDHGLMAVCYLDLDGFKPINDKFGHDAGDKVLVEITRRIKEAIREDDTVARLGGDEFVVLLVGMQVPEECVGSLNRLLQSINQPIEVQGKSLNISASIGVSLYPEDEQDPDTLLRHADQAMYVAKQSGKNRYHLFDAASDQRARSHHELLQQIRQGLALDEFELYYQPKIEMKTRRLVGAEALIRWNHPRRGLLLPAEFLRIIENTELEIELGDWVIATAIDQLRRWRAGGFAIEVSINVSAYHLQSPGFVEKLKAQANLCCPGNCYGTLQVEVLETAALEDIASVGSIIKECKEFGMGFALDDFGTGYSSLSYLSKFDVDVLKIDQSFIRDMLDDKGDHAIVMGIIALARAFDMGIVAEGVETEAHYEALLQMGCEIGQGYGIARPMPASELINWQKI